MQGAVEGVEREPMRADQEVLEKWGTNLAFPEEADFFQRHQHRHSGLCGTGLEKDG